MLRRTLLRIVAAAIATVPIVKSATVAADHIPGVTATEIKIGNTPGTAVVSDLSSGHAEGRPAQE